MVLLLEPKSPGGTVDIKTIKTIVPNLPPHIAVLMRGPTGVGKSHVARAFADELGLPFIDVRGSTMDEAKVGGLPDMKAVDEKKVATFVVPSWFKTACDQPCVIMLDELNPLNAYRYAGFLPDRSGP